MVCKLCDKTFSKNQKQFYASHLAKHEAEKHSCTCDIQGCKKLFFINLFLNSMIDSS